MRRLALAAAVLAAGALAAPAPAARVPERGFDLVVSAQPPVEPRTPTLYSLDPATGERTRLSRTTRAHESAPTPSPDGRLLAFVRGALGAAQEVWTARADGSRPRLVGEGTSPAWAPDSRRLAYAGPEGVVVLPTRGGPGRLVGPGGSFPAFSPDGALLAYLVPQSPGLSSPVRLEVVDLAGGTPRTLLAQAGPFAWAPDGGSLAVRVGLATAADRGALRLVGVDGKVAWETEPHGLSHAPAFVPRRGAIALLEEGGISLYDAADGRRRPLFPQPGCVGPVAFSTDGGRLACVAAAPGARGRVVRVQALAGTARTFGLPEREATGVAWLPDGRLAVSWRALESRDPELVRVDPGTGRAIALTDDRYSQLDPVWSPDGTRLLYRVGRHVVVARADGSQPRRAPDPTGAWRSWDGLDWSPDGRAVLRVGRDGFLRLWSLDDGAIVDGQLAPGSSLGGAVDWSSLGDLAYTTDSGIAVAPLRAVRGALRAGTPRLVVPGGFHPRWSRDGSRLAYVRVVGNACGLYCDVVLVATAARDGSDERILVSSPGFRYVRDLAWSGDGRSVAVISELEAGERLELMRAETPPIAVPLALSGLSSLDWRAPLRRP
ncbi:MAG: hypothetical protein R3C15_15875 [Thermoleophilia bacterium]